MDLLQLRYFCHAAESENFSRTAQAFFVPPSAVSVSIKKLETELGTPLFTRTSNRVRLNPQGQYYYDCIRQALSLIDEGSRTLREGGQTEKIRVGIRLARRRVLYGINTFREQYPEVEVVHNKFGPDSPLEDYDIVIADNSLENENYTKETLLHDRLVLVAAKGLLPHGDLTAEFLKEQTFISLPPDSVMYQNTCRVCRALGFEPKFHISAEDSVYFVPRCLEQGIGVALTYPHAQWLLFMSHLVDIRDVGPFYHEICIYRRKKNAPPHTSQLYDAIKNYHLQYYKAEQLPANQK